MKIEPGKFCPIVRGDCKKFDCMFWTQLRGTHPQTGDPIDEWDCAIKWLPILLIENAKETRSTTAALESFRNEMVRGQQSVLGEVKNGELEKMR